MGAPADVERADRSRLAVILRAGEEECVVHVQDGSAVVGYAASFPTPRVERLAPGHLVTLARAPDGAEVIVWRWFDAVVIGERAGGVPLWEPAHGEVLAQPRRPEAVYRPGTRAYLSAGLPGADWRVAGPAVGRAEDADVEVEEVHQFLTRLGVLAAGS